MGTFPFIIAQLVIIVKTNSVHSGTGASSSSLKAGKVIIEKSPGEASLMEQDTIENVSEPINF